MKTIPAIYENGVFHPKEQVSLAPGAEVRIILPDDRDPVEIMKERFPQSFGVISAEDADEMQRIIDEEFGKVDPDDWR